MPLIDASILSQIQGLSEDTMPDTVFIEHFPSPTLDEFGGQVEGTPTAVVTKGRVSTGGGKPGQSAAEADRSGQLRQDVAEVLTVPLDTQVEPDSRVTVLSARLGTETRYTVEEIVPRGTMTVHRQIVIKPEKP